MLTTGLVKELTRAETAASCRSSLMSQEIALPNDNVYRRYDDAIEAMDDEDEVETAVSFAAKSQKSQTSRSREESVSN